MAIALDGKPTTQELRAILADVLDIDESLITPEAHFINDLGVDSLMALEVMVVLEKKYQIKITEKEMQKITCLSSVSELLESKRG